MRHLAQLNVGRLRYDIDDPRMADFVGNLARVNALADRAEGFVWRLQDDGGNATSFRPYDDPRIAINMSVWESVEALERYVWQTVHKRFYGRRREWFEEFEGPYFRDVVGAGRTQAQHRGGSRAARSPQAARSERTCFRLGGLACRAALEVGALRIVERNKMRRTARSRRAESLLQSLKAFCDLTKRLVNDMHEGVRILNSRFDPNEPPFVAARLCSFAVCLATILIVALLARL